MQRGNYLQAVAKYRETLAIDPDYVMAHGGLGEALFALERYEEAMLAATRALDLDPEDRFRGALHRLLGRSNRALGRFEMAESEFRRAMDLEPQDAAPLFELSRLRREQKRLEEADDYLRRARALLPSEASALQRVAEGLRKQGLREEALSAYRAVLELDPDYAFAYGGMGHTLFDLERYEDAAEAMTTALSLRADLPMAAILHVLIGRASKQTGRLEAAAEQFPARHGDRSPGHGCHRPPSPAALRAKALRRCTPPVRADARNPARKTCRQTRISRPPSTFSG